MALRRPDKGKRVVPLGGTFKSRSAAANVFVLPGASQRSAPHLVIVQSHTLSDWFAQR